MLEVLAILTLLFVGAIVVGAIALLAGLVKFTFKLALLPVVLGLKGLVFVIGFVIALVVVGPVVLVLGILLLIPILILGGLVWAGVAVFTLFWDSPTPKKKRGSHPRTRAVFNSLFSNSRSELLPAHDRIKDHQERRLLLGFGLFNHRQTPRVVELLVQTISGVAGCDDHPLQIDARLFRRSQDFLAVHFRHFPVEQQKMDVGRHTRNRFGRVGVGFDGDLILVALLQQLAPDGALQSGVVDHHRATRFSSGHPEKPTPATSNSPGFRGLDTRRKIHPPARLPTDHTDIHRRVYLCGSVFICVICGQYTVGRTGDRFLTAGVETERVYGSDELLYRNAVTANQRPTFVQAHLGVGDSGDLRECPLDAGDTTVAPHAINFELQ